MEIPDKQYFKIGEVARLLDEPPHVIRYWESEFPAIKPKRAGTSQQRLYRREDVELFWGIRSMLRDRGYTLAGARKVLRREDDEAAREGVGTGGEMVTVPRDALRAIKDGLTALRETLAEKGRLSD
ncbi:MAG: MerR family transcriptional regulator [Desulfobulbaceae bacterium]|jgi:DNA-binding transcriptional MerR regulator|nr:MerR family transcriptional regulator [Desulfobulbaceae bacterium]